MEKKKQKISFDEALLSLEDIARLLDSGELGLEESIARYEEGIKLARLCQEKLEESERKIEMLQKKGDKVEKKEICVKTETGEIDDDDEVQGSLL